VPNALDQLREELVIANRILTHEGIVDAFGHVSARHPTDPGRFLISRHRAPELVEPGDLLEFTLDYKPVTPTAFRLYSEGIIHGAIYAARPDVHAVCHHHSPAVLPFCISGTELVPVYHLGAAMGPKVPFWDQQDEFGDTTLLVVKPEEGRSLARALGNNWTVLMRRHGATVAGASIRELVFRTVYGCANAEMQWKAQMQGHVSQLTSGEATMSGSHSTRPGPMERAWDFWERRLRRAGGYPADARPKTARAKDSARRKSNKTVKRSSKRS